MKKLGFACLDTISIFTYVQKKQRLNQNEDQILHMTRIICVYEIQIHCKWKLIQVQIVGNFRGSLSVFESFNGLLNHFQNPVKVSRAEMTEKAASYPCH